jgi:hypothetical protein
MTVAVEALGWVPPLAHGGRFTWDEALMVLAPIALLAGLLVLANKRANAIQRSRLNDEANEPDAAAPVPDQPERATGAN